MDVVVSHFVTRNCLLSNVSTVANLALKGCPVACSYIAAVWLLPLLGVRNRMTFDVLSLRKTLFICIVLFFFFFGALLVLYFLSPCFLRLLVHSVVQVQRPQGCFQADTKRPSRPHQAHSPSSSLAAVSIATADFSHPSLVAPPCALPLPLCTGSADRLVHKCTIQDRVGKARPGTVCLLSVPPAVSESQTRWPANWSAPVCGSCWPSR